MAEFGDDGDGSERASEAAPIHGATALTVEDFTAAWRQLPQVRVGMRTLAAWLVGGVFLAVLVPYMSGAEFTLSPTSTGALIFSPLVVCALAFGFWRGRKRFAVNALADTRGGEGMSFQFDTEGVSFEAPGRSASMSWDVVPRTIETQSLFIVYASQQSIIVAPKRAFAHEDVARLSALLRARVVPKALRGEKSRPLRKVALWLVLIVLFLCVWQFLEQR